MRRRVLALEALEMRAVPATDPLHALLDVGDRLSIHWQGVAHKPNGEIRIVEAAQGGIAWDFDHAGRRLDIESLALPQFADQPAAGQLVSPDGSWVVAQYYDFDTSPGHVWNPVVARWNGTDPTGAERIDVSSLPGRFVTVKAVSNSGDLILTGVQSSYRWNAETGIVALAPLPITSTGESPFAIATAISADGSVVVGYTASWPNSVPTFWDSAGPHPLAPVGNRGSAIAVSDDGRVIVGVLEKDSVQHAVVWVDGRLTELRDENGELVTGTIRTVTNGLGGDPTRWAVLGESSVGRPWIAFSDGAAQPLGTWLSQNYGIGLGSPSQAAPGGGLILSGTTNLFSVLDAFAHDDALEIVIADLVVVGTTNGIPGSPIYGHSKPHLIIAPLTAETAAVDEQLLDMNNDGSVSPIDALIVINALNSADGKILSERPELLLVWPKIDTSGDGELTPLDALLVINFLISANGEAANIEAATSETASAEDNFVLPLEQIGMSSAARLPNGNLRITQFGTSVTDFDPHGNPAGEMTVPLAAGQTIGTVTAVSPSGRWLAGSQQPTGNYNSADPATWGPVGLWETQNSLAFHAIDFSGFSTQGWITAASDSGVALVGVNGISTYRWDAVHGLTRLASLVDSGGEPLHGLPRSVAWAMSADGAVIVGDSGDSAGPTFATRWLDTTRPERLPDLGGVSQAWTVSLDGRLIGGTVYDPNQDVNFGGRPLAVVWIDAKLTVLKDAQGNAITGSVDRVVNGVDGDPLKWVAFGSSTSGQFIAFSGGHSQSGNVQSLADWLRENYSIDLTDPQTIVNAFIDGKELSLVCYDNRILPLYPFEIGQGLDHPPIKQLPPEANRLITVVLRDKDFMAADGFSPSSAAASVGEGELLGQPTYGQQ